MGLNKILLLLLIALCFALPVRSAQEDDLRISAEKLLSHVKKGDPIVILDVRAPGPYKSSPKRIKGDIRIEDESELETKLKDVPHDRLIVAYCT